VAALVLETTQETTVNPFVLQDPMVILAKTVANQLVVLVFAAANVL